MRVFIVEDEIVIRVGLKSLIDWEQAGYVIVGEAADGQKALEDIARLKPDIVITDIKMPVMDGITLMQRLAERPASPKIIVHSSYNDFALVREAMRLGAADYLLKLDMNAESLRATLNEARGAIAASSRQTDEERLYKTDLRKNMHVLRGKLFRDMLHFNVSLEELQPLLGLYDIAIDFDNVACIAMRISNIYGREHLKDRDLELLQYSISNIAEEILNDTYVGCCFLVSQYEFGAVFSADNRDTMTNACLTDVLETIADMLKTYINIDVHIGFGSWGQGAFGVRASWKEAGDALAYCLSASSKRVVSWQDADRDISISTGYTVMAYKSKLLEALEYADAELLELIMRQIVDDLSGGALSLDNQVNACLEMRYIVSEFCDKHDIGMTDMRIPGFGTTGHPAQLASYSNVHSWLNQLKERLLEYVKAVDRTGGARSVMLAKKYIDEYYRNEISLTEVADEVNLSPFYLSHLFVRHTGMSFTDYLTAVRLDHAKQLLKETNLKMYEIAEMIGYSNITYFNRIFKKMTGMTPAQFRSKSGL